MSISQTSEYARKNYLSQYKVFSIKNHHRATTNNRTDEAWIKCPACVDKRTCLRTERFIEGKCESGLTPKKVKYYWEEMEDRLYSTIMYKVNL